MVRTNEFMDTKFISNLWKQKKRITMRLYDWATLRKVYLKKPKVREAHTQNRLAPNKITVIYGSKKAHHKQYSPQYDSRVKLQMGKQVIITILY